jgi:hypothetical protein
MFDGPRNFGGILTRGGACAVVTVILSDAPTMRRSLERGRPIEKCPLIGGAHRPSRAD